MGWRAGVLLVVVWLGGCGTSGSVTPDEPARAAVIVVPGYYGTKLVRISDGDEVWLSAGEALFGNRSLRLPLPGQGFAGALALRPQDILRRISIIPWVYTVQGYGALLDALRDGRLGGARVTPLPYDWRLDLMEAVRALDVLVDSLRHRGHERITIVAHSMGGLIAGYYLRYGAQDPASAVENWEGASRVAAVVMAGVPFRGSMTAFRNAQYGVRIGLNRVLLEPSAVASFPATYYLLPTGEADVLLTPAGDPVKGMIREDTNWKASAWGLLRDAHSVAPAAAERRFAYTSDWLHRAGRFLELLHGPPAVPTRRRIPLLYLAAAGHPTLARGVWLHAPSGSAPGRLLFDREHFEHALSSINHGAVLDDGDGSVTIRSSALPPAYESAFHVTVKQQAVTHGELASDAAVIEKIVEFLGRHMAVGEPP